MRGIVIGVWVGISEKLVMIPSIAFNLFRSLIKSLPYHLFFVHLQFPP